MDPGHDIFNNIKISTNKVILHAYVFVYFLISYWKFLLQNSVRRAPIFKESYPRWYINLVSYAKIGVLVGNKQSIMLCSTLSTTS